jgi:large subunit ribosomal protein L23
VTFKVGLLATKPEIKVAVEQLFDRKVKAVNTLRQKGKVKRFRGRIGRRSDFKKAVVSFEDGQDVDVSQGV